MKRNGWFWLCLVLLIYLYFLTTDRCGVLQISHWTFHSFHFLNPTKYVKKSRLKTAINIFIVVSFCCSMSLESVRLGPNLRRRKAIWLVIGLLFIKEINFKNVNFIMIINKNNADISHFLPLQQFPSSALFLWTNEQTKTII